MGNILPSWLKSSLVVVRKSGGLIKIVAQFFV